MELELSDPWFDPTKRGLKTRLYNHFFFRRFDKTEPSFSVVVKKVHLFPSFRDALTELDIYKVLPIHGLTIQTGVDIL
jgi:hypothetical protein